MDNRSGASHHRQAAEHHELAAKHYRVAAEHHEAGECRPGGTHAHIAQDTSLTVVDRDPSTCWRDFPSGVGDREDSTYDKLRGISQLVRKHTAILLLPSPLPKSCVNTQLLRALF
jgi:hypothetical protein